MKQKVYQVDAFAQQVFLGNPAAVCPLEQWLDDNLMQAIAAENNLSETAFFVAKEHGYELRWFTPVTEVDLCGHATLAAAWVLVNELKLADQNITFFTRSGELRVIHHQGKLTLDFPVEAPVACKPPRELVEGLNIPIVKVMQGTDYLVLVASESLVRQVSPDFEWLRQLPRRGVIITAKGDTVDFVSRWFGPKVGVNEDPVTGSAHTLLTPFWADQLGQNLLTARQLSERGGELTCELNGGRVLISGSAVTYMEGFIYL